MTAIQLVTVGVKHIKFWTQKGAALTGKRGVFGKEGAQVQACSERLE